MRKYEAMFIVNPELSEEERKNLFNQIHEVITKNNGKLTNSGIWAEKRKLYFPLKKHREGVYYLINFDVSSDAISKIRHSFGLNENILRTLITVKE